MQVLASILAVMAFGGVFPQFGCSTAFAQELMAPATSTTTIETPRTRSRWRNNTWQINSGVESRSEGKDDGFATVVAIETKLNFQLAPWMKIQLAPYANFYSSRVQERFDDDTYDSRFGLDYGFLNVQPVKNLSLKLGAISMRDLQNKQMVSKFRSFPGANLSYSHKIFRGLEVGAEAQYLIPTSSSLNTERQDREELPNFQTQALFAEYKALGTKTQFKGGAFSWDNLPGKVAINSTRAGNIPANGDLDAETRFRYGFSGWFGTLSSEWISQDLDKIGVAFRRFSNTQAPSNYADSQNLEVFGKLWTGNLGWGAGAGQFFSEAQATPASYASSSFGNTNRKGRFIDAEVDFKEYQFKLMATYIAADVINANPYQDDMTNLTLWVETYEFKF